jgi:hypothetical protein
MLVSSPRIIASGGIVGRSAGQERVGAQLTRPSELGLHAKAAWKCVAMLIRMVCFADRIGNGAGRARIAFGDVLISRRGAAHINPKLGSP